jgi:hypothetical protein
MPRDAACVVVGRGRGCQGAYSMGGGVKLLGVRGKSVVGAEISGPALPRITSGWQLRGW